MSRHQQRLVALVAARIKWWESALDKGIRCSNCHRPRSNVPGSLNSNMMLCRVGLRYGYGILRRQAFLSTNATMPDLIVSKKCAERIRQLRETEKVPVDAPFGLRVAVDSGGCSGFQYVFNLEKSPPSSEEDAVFERDGAKVIVDQASLNMLKGATIDYTQELIRSAFAVTNNPNSESGCGCGVSFSAKA